MRFTIFLAATASLLSPRSAVAVPTATFNASTYKQFDQGKPEGTLISNQGEVLAGRSATALAGVKSAMIWSRARIGGHRLSGQRRSRQAPRGPR